MKAVDERLAEADARKSAARHSFAAARHDELMRSSAEYRAVYARYHDGDGNAKHGWLKAPNGNDTNLEPYQWVQVRTPSFIRWFGDWVSAAKLKAVDSLVPIKITNRPEGETAKSSYAMLGEGINSIDGRRVRFVNSTFGKIIRHKGFETARVVHQLKEIFNGAIPLVSEGEKELVRPDGTVHKRHPNFAGYHTYLGKISDGRNTFYVRFTVQEEKTRKKDYNPNVVHSTFVSDVLIYNDGKALSLSTTKVGESELSRTDDILSQFLSELNAKSAESSKIVDGNGEPMVVYHRSSDSFSVFEKEKIHWDMDVGGFYFADYKDYEDLRDRPYELQAFLNMRNPYVAAYGKAFERLVLEVPTTSSRAHTQGSLHLSPLMSHGSTEEDSASGTNKELPLLVLRKGQFPNSNLKTAATPY